MRIAVNTRLLQKNKLDGIGWFSYETLRRITRDHPEHEFIFIFDRKWDKDFVFSENIKPVRIPIPTRHILLFIPWFELLLPLVLYREKADLFLSPDGHLSLISNVPTIPVIHDLNFEHFPEHLPILVRWYYRFFFPKFARKAIRIATVSEYTKTDIIKHYGIKTEKINVTYNGCNANYRVLNEEEKIAVKQKFSEGCEYFIFIGLIIPRKNLIGLMQAFEMMKNQTGSPVKLLVIGSRKWWDKKHETTFTNMKHQKDVMFLGRRSPEELADLLGAALALTYIPLFEGFGIPILEAFASGTPVITSSVTSMPEVSGDAALLVDPTKPEQIAHAMVEMLCNKQLRQDFILKGLVRKEHFSWDATAQKLWDCIQQSSMA